MSSLLKASQRKCFGAFNRSVINKSNTIIALSESKRLISTSIPANAEFPESQPKKTAPKYQKELLSYQKSYKKTLKASEFDNAFDKDGKLETDFGSLSRNSFTSKITEEQASLIPSILALHSRLRLSDNYKKSTLVRALTCKMDSSNLADNTGMAIFGSHLMEFYTSEYFVANYPRLPYGVQKLATDAFIGDFSLYDVAKIWGIQEDITSNLEKYLANEPELHRYGRLRYERSVSEVEPGVTKTLESDSEVTHFKTAEAHATAVRAIIAGIYAHDGEEAARDFFKNHVLSRKIDLTQMFKFEGAGRLLSKVLTKQKMASPTVRLMSETGRLSKYPVFNVGVFSGNDLIGEGAGSSLKEARVRATVNALMAFYLYRPLDPKLISDEENFRPLFVDEGESFF